METWVIYELLRSILTFLEQSFLKKKLGYLIACW